MYVMAYYIDKTYSKEHTSARQVCMQKTNSAQHTDHMCLQQKDRQTSTTSTEKLSPYEMHQQTMAPKDVKIGSLPNCPVPGIECAN